MDFTTLRYAVEDGIAIITFNRAEKLNVFDATMIREFIQAFDVTDADDAVRAVVVTGAGRAFSAGADLSAGTDVFYAKSKSGVTPTAGDYRDGAGLLTLRIFESLKPVIAAVNGPAVGMGATLQLAMDFRLASETAKFGFVFSRRGIVPEGASAWFLPRLVGIPTAIDWCISGRTFDAQEALERGLVCSVHAQEDLVPAARALAHRLTDSAAPVSVALARQMIWRMAGASHPMEAHCADSRGLFHRGRSTDAVEGVSAFLEKRQARFSDRVSSALPDIWTFWDRPQFR